MINYLLIVAAVLITSAIVASCFGGEFPFLSYDNRIAQIVFRAIFVVANILLLISAILYPYPIEGCAQSLLTYIAAVIYTVIVYAFLEVVYYLANVLVLCILSLIWEGILKILGWIVYDDAERFVFHDDD
jgi:hypothetical protein